jgi:hypothetical protein
MHLPSGALPPLHREASLTAQQAVSSEFRRRWNGPCGSFD